MRGLRAPFLIVSVLLVACAVSVSGALRGEDISYAVWRNTPILVTLLVTDPAIDPLAPASHPIAFLMHQAPAHGVVAVDFSQVIYLEPTTAVLVASYTPAVGYVGEDLFIVQAENVTGDSVFLRVSLDVVAPDSAGVLSGTSWMTTTIDVQSASYTSAEVSGTVEYSVQATRLMMGYRLKRATPADDLFDDLYFAIHSPFGSFTTLSGRLEFDPAGAPDLFRRAHLRTTTRVGNVSMTSTARTDGSPGGTSLALSLSGRTIDGLYLEANASFAPCESMFQRATLLARYAFTQCGADCAIHVSASAGFTCGGFEKMTISASGLRLPDVPVAHFSGTASVTVVYELQEKTVTFTPSVTSSWIEGVCFRVLISRDPLAPEIVQWRSIHVDHTFSNGVRLRMDTSLDPYDLSLNQLVTGHMDYWERDTLSGRFTVCEGIGGNWEIATYFARPGVGTTLFSWGMTEMKVEVDCYQVWKFLTKVTFRSGVFGGPTAEWLLGVQFTW